MKYRYRDWLFFYLLLVVPLNLAMWITPPFVVSTNPHFWGWVIYFTVIMLAINILWYKASEILASRVTHAKRIDDPQEVEK